MSNEFIIKACVYGVLVILLMIPISCLMEMTTRKIIAKREEDENEKNSMS